MRNVYAPNWFILRSASLLIILERRKRIFKKNTNMSRFTIASWAGLKCSWTVDLGDQIPESIAKTRKNEGDTVEENDS